MTQNDSNALAKPTKSGVFIMMMVTEPLSQNSSTFITQLIVTLQSAHFLKKKL